MRGNSILRPLVRRCSSYHGSGSSSSRFIETLTSTPKMISSPNPSIPKIPLSNDKSQLSNPLFLQCRRTLFSPSEGSEPSEGSPPQSPANVVPIKSEEEFNSSLSKVQEESLPAMFYFTAVWCAPCRFFSPVIDVLSGRYPHVTTYKIDIDQDELKSALGKINVTSVPTVHLFQSGEKKAEIIGADIVGLRETMEKLYKK